MDLIDRKVIMQYLVDNFTDNWNFDDLINAVSRMPLEKIYCWYPVTKHTPDEGQEVLVSDGKYVYLVEYDIDYEYGDMDGITAWMPLPEPYRPARNDGRETGRDCEDKYTIDQIVDAIMQSGDAVIMSIRCQDSEMLRDAMIDFIS